MSMRLKNSDLWWRRSSTFRILLTAWMKTIIQIFFALIKKVLSEDNDFCYLNKQVFLFFYHKIEYKFPNKNVGIRHIWKVKVFTI